MSLVALRSSLAALLAASLSISPVVALAAPSSTVSAGSEVTAVAGSPTAQPTNAAPVYGDLSHLEFTATGSLTAQLVSPEPGGASDREAATFEVSTVAGAGVEVSVNGTLVETKQIGKRTIDKKTGETHYFFYGVHLIPGPNDVVLTPLGAGTLRGTPFRTTVYGPGQPVRVQAKLVGDLRADGRTSAILQIVAFDRWNHSALPGTTVHVAILKGDAHFESVRHHREGGAPTNEAGSLAVPASGAQTQNVADLLSNVVAPPPAAVPTDAADFAQNGDEYGDPHALSAQGQDLNHLAVGDSNAQFQSFDVTLLSHGTAMLAVIPGLNPGDLVIRATIADTQSEVRAFIMPALRKPMVLGLATAGVGSVPGVPGESVDAPEGADARRGRIALYGVGQLTKTVQATIAYDTADTLDLSNNYGAFADNPDSRPYQTFGDGSVQRDDALSRDHLYARIDDNRSSLMWGEFQADTGGTSGIGGFSQLVDGAKVEIAGSNAKVTAFQARNDIAYARQVFIPTGLSNLGGLLHPEIVVGSDTVTLAVLDRRTGAILSQTVLTRNVDYVLDYDSGFLRFINPPLPFDAYFNPQEVLVTYEYGGTGANAETSGGRFEDAIGKSQAVRFGIGYVNDSTGSGNLVMSNEDISGNLPGGSWSIGHISTKGSIAGDTETLANTQLGSAGNANGDAYNFSLATALGVTKVNLGFDVTSQNFNNPFGGLSTPGLLDYRAAFTRPLFGTGTFTASFDHQQNNLSGSVTSQSDASLNAHVPITSKLTATAGVDIRSESAFSAASAQAAAAQVAGDGAVNPVSTATPTAVNLASSDGAGSAQANLGLEYKINKIFKASVNRVSNIGKSQNASAPAETTAELDADIAKRGRVYIRELWADAPTVSFAASTAELTGIDGARSSTAIGIERSLGNSTDVDSEYVVDHTASGSDAYAEMGVREKLAIGPNLRGEASFQRASTFGGATSGVLGSDAVAPGAEGEAASTEPSPTGFNIYGLSLAYSIARFHASGQYQIRTGDESGYTLDLGAAGALSPDFSAFVSSHATSSGTGFNSVDSKATIAYRPSLNDRSVTLASYERQSGDIQELSTNAGVLSLEELVRPTRLTEIAVRYAYKLDGDAYYPARSSLFGVRLDQRITSRFDFAAETRYLSAHNIPNASTTAFAVEAGYRVGNDLRVAGGYNFSGSPDPSLVGAPTRRGVYGTVTSVIDNIFGWGKDGQ